MAHSLAGPIKVDRAVASALAVSLAARIAQVCSSLNLGRLFSRRLRNRSPGSTLGRSRSMR